MVSDNHIGKLSLRADVSCEVIGAFAYLFQHRVARVPPFTDVSANFPFCREVWVISM
jgi:hypothetical protein